MASNPAIRAPRSPIKLWDPLITIKQPENTPLSGRLVVPYNSYYETRFIWNR